MSVAQIDTLSLKHMKPKDLKQLGRNAYEQTDYNSCVTYLEYYFKKPSVVDSKSELILAHAYRQTRDYKKAEAMYAKAYKSDPANNVEALYYQAQMQKTFANYDGAKENLVKFKKEYKGDDKALKKGASKEIDLCDSSKKNFTIEKKIVLKHLDTTINKVHVEAAPISIDTTTFIYSALRTNKKEYIIEGDTNNILVRKFYQAKKVNSTWQYQGEWNEKLNTPGEEVSNASFTPDGKKMYFSKCKPNWQGKMVCALYFSELNNDEWTEPVKLEAPINESNSNNSMPAVTIDPLNGNEIVYFVSDRKQGSKGGKDIWFFTYSKKKKKYTAPKNAGNTVNTNKDELTPFFDNETRTLYFSSEGWGSIGGYDVYKSTGDGKKWTNAENVGKPINSGADDIYFSISKDRELGFVVSNREGGNALKNCTCCDDIYEYKHLQYVRVNLDGTISEKIDSANSVVSAGSVVELYVKDKTSGEKILIKTTTTDEKGNYSFSVESGNEYELLVKKTGFLSSDTAFSTRDIVTSTNITENLVLSKVPAEPIRIKNLEYEFNKADLTPSSKIILDTTIYKLMVNNPQLIIEILSHTDDKGGDDYNMKLSQKRAESVVNYLTAKGISNDRLQAKGYGETKPIEPNSNADGSDNPEGRARNRRTEFKVVGHLDIEIINESDE